MKRYKVPQSSYDEWSDKPGFVNFTTMNVGDEPRGRPLGECPLCHRPGEVWPHLGVTVHAGLEMDLTYGRGFGYRLQCDW